MHAKWAEKDQQRQQERQRAIEALQHAEQRHLLAARISRDRSLRPDFGKVPDEISRFLLGPWSQVMAQARLTDTTRSADPGRYEELVDALIWSTQPALTRANTGQLARLLPKLLAKLREGLASIDYTAARTESVSERSGALVERYIEGREFYVGVIGNGHLQALPVWELIMDKLPDDAKRIATERVKWSGKYQQKYGITSREAVNLPESKTQEIQDLAKQVYRALGLSGYARIDMRMDAEAQLYVLEANPNPQIAEDEDFADSAKETGYTYTELLQELLNVGLRWRPAKAA